MIRYGMANAPKACACMAKRIFAAAIADSEFGIGAVAVLRQLPNLSREVVVAKNGQREAGNNIVRMGEAHALHQVVLYKGVKVLQGRAPVTSWRVRLKRRVQNSR